MWTSGEKCLTYDQAKKDSSNAKKDFKLVSKKRTVSKFITLYVERLAEFISHLPRKPQGPLVFTLPTVHLTAWFSRLFPLYFEAEI